MSNIILSSAKDAGNRGCEGIARGIARILTEKKMRRIIAYSENLTLDKMLGLDSVLDLKSIPYMYNSKIASNIYYHMRQQLIKDARLKLEYRLGRNYEGMVHKICNDDIALSTGGDMLCYGDNELFYINKTLHSRGTKTVLWGCSVGKENLTTEKIELLHVFDAIIARETITYELMKKLGLNNVSCIPDAAFSLHTQECNLPNYFSEADILGINFSNFIGENISFNSPVGKNIECLLDTVLKETKLKILLIPHVFWEGQDDRIVCKAVYDKYRSTGRVYLLDSEKLSYCQIRYIISKCRFFIGARTHAMISAYCTEVPALALGYSVKSRGIARDIGLPQELVVNIKHLDNKNIFSNGLKYLIEHEDKIKQIYDLNLASYKMQSFEAEKVITALE
ncbi:polysaccharide pyruvyl transferase family protein [Hungatella hathewayi]|uniref:polysaccharide pyruvyl transferase family protein n=1 Tax=Hungatella hathewayi TaxID=154046 RepID=UPI00210C4CE3|nr:polysaccharide pyruvyl transferase family protein [Hungatella hathewayi]MCQ5386531.1 polysaccharide pyruvyl transferase family protein [Hungatella hathewayi]